MSWSKLMTVTAVLLAVLASAGRTDGPQAEKERADRHGDPLPSGAVARLGTVRFRAGGWGVSVLGFLADGKTLVSANSEAIQFWEAGTGKLLREIRLGKLSGRNFTLSPNGKYVAASGFRYDEEKGPDESVIRIWDTASSKEVRSLQRKSDDVDHCALAFTSDGKFLMSMGSRTGLLRIEEVASGVEILNHQFPRDVMGSLAISPDGSTVAVGSGPNTHKLFVWKWQTAEEPRTLKAPRYAGRSLAFSPDNKRLAECGDTDEEVRVWDVASGRLLHKLEPPDTENHWHGAVIFSPDGKTLIASSRSNRAGTIHLWDATSGKYRNRLDGGAGSLAISTDSRLLAAGGDGPVHVWDLASGKELAADEEAHQGAVSRIAVVGNVVATAGDDHTVRLWDAGTGRQRLKLTHDYWVRGIALSPDGARLVSSSLDDTVGLWDTATGRKIYSLPGHGKYGGYRPVAFMPDGKHFLSCGDDLYLRKWDVKTGKALLEHALRPTGVKVPDPEDEARDRERFFDLGEGTFSPDGKTFVMIAGNEFHVFDTATGKDLRQIANEGSHVASLTISPDGKMLLASAWGKPVQTKLPDGRTRISSEKNHPVCLWDLSTGKMLKQILLPDGGAGPVAFSADGKLFATATDKPERRIRLWDTVKGEEVGTITGFRSVVRSLAFSTDGKRLISGMDDTTALVWDLEKR
jgi:WD40 repeat protein